MGGLKKEEDQHLFQLPPILTQMGIHLSHQPPTIITDYDFVHTVSVAGVRVTDLPRLRCL